MKFTYHSLLLFFLFINPEREYVPPGTLKINDLFIDRTEIFNIHWLEYLHWKGLELDSISRQKNLPDSTNFWYTFPHFRYHPITGITYEQAVDYCKWRSEMVNKRTSKKVTYRLPTISEWTMVAEYELSNHADKLEENMVAVKAKILTDTTGYTLFECKEPKDEIYHLFDNVSEMTADKEIAMGANNLELVPLKRNLTRKIRYKGANSYLGFRCVAMVEN